MDKQFRVLAMMQFIFLPLTFFAGVRPGELYCMHPVITMIACCVMIMNVSNDCCT